MNLQLKIFLFSFFLVLASKAQSQFSYGIKVGVNGNNVSVNAANVFTEIEASMKLGLHFGGVIDYKLNENLSLQSGLILNNKGYTLDLSFLSGNNENVKSKYVATYNYIEIPLSINFKLKNGLQVFTGPYIGFGMAGREKVSTKVNTDTAIYKFGLEYNLKPVIGKVRSSDLIDDESPYNGFAYGFKIALGYTKGKASINLVYSHGLSNVLPKSNSRFDKIYNRTLALSLIYLIPKKD